jgi:hypothetical protein
MYARARHSGQTLSGCPPGWSSRPQLTQVAIHELYTTQPGALMDPTRGSDDRGRGPDRDRGHAHEGEATPNNQSQSPCLTKEARF